jgi:hypothetical protein
MVQYPKGYNLYIDYESLMMVFPVVRRSLVDFDFMKKVRKNRIFMGNSLNPRRIL